MITRASYKKRLNGAEATLRELLGLDEGESVETALVLGTGWADAFPFEADFQCPMGHLELFNGLEVLDGHPRRFEIGTINGQRVIVLRGRIHMNEGIFNPEMKLLVRAQIDILVRLGLKNLIPTTGVGAIKGTIKTGSVVLINGWVSSYGEVMPLFPGEFVNPEDVIATDLFEAIRAGAPSGLPVIEGSHLFWLGPHFEGRAHDKHRMLADGADVVSMSVKPECCVAALHDGVRVIPMAFVTNGPSDKMEHEAHRAAAKAAAGKLGALLEHVVGLVST